MFVFRFDELDDRYWATHAIANGISIKIEGTLGPQKGQNGQNTCCFWTETEETYSTKPK